MQEVTQNAPESPAETQCDQLTDAPETAHQKTGAKPLNAKKSGFHKTLLISCQKKGLRCISARPLTPS